MHAQEQTLRTKNTREWLIKIRLVEYVECKERDDRNS